MAEEEARIRVIDVIGGDDSVDIRGLFTLVYCARIAEEFAFSSKGDGRALIVKIVGRVFQMCMTPKPRCEVAEVPSGCLAQFLDKMVQ